MQRKLFLYGIGYCVSILFMTAALTLKSASILGNYGWLLLVVPVGIGMGVSLSGLPWSIASSSKSWALWSLLLFYALFVGGIYGSSVLGEYIGSPKRFFNLFSYPQSGSDKDLTLRFSDLLTFGPSDPPAPH